MVYNTGMCYCLIRNKITDEYKVLRRRDIPDFLRLGKFFNSDSSLPEGKTVDFNFEVIQDFDTIKEVLDTKFTSQDRGKEYDENLPSVSQVAYSLFPIDLASDKFLLRWQNNHDYSQDDEMESQNILSRGTFIHFILEQFVCDRESREQDKPLIDRLKKRPSKEVDQLVNDRIHKLLEVYIQKAYEDEEIGTKIPNLEELKPELEELTYKCLPNFLKEEIIFNDLVYSEIFLIAKDYLQGSIDFVAYHDNKFSILDYKTTSTCDKKTGRPKFKTPGQAIMYSRQLALYNELLKENNMTHCADDEIPNFYIYQIHLISGKYKKFEIPYESIVCAKRQLKKVLEWYWDTRNGIKKEYIDEDDTELNFLTL